MLRVDFSGLTSWRGARPRPRRRPARARHRAFGHRKSLNFGALASFAACGGGASKTDNCLKSACEIDVEP